MTAGIIVLGVAGLLYVIVDMKWTASVEERLKKIEAKLEIK